MTLTVEAIFDGLILRPLDPLELAPNTRVTLMLTVSGLAAADPAASLRTPEHLYPAAAPSGEEDETQDLTRYMCENYFYSDFYFHKK